MDEVLRTIDVKRVLVLGMLLFWCACMIAVRIERTGSGYYGFLLWNLFLAGVPLFLSTVMRAANNLGTRRIFQLGLFALWLLFLPNSPYILTDILHLTRASHAPAWYDLALLLSCSGTGLLLGYLSLIDVQEIVARRFTPAIAWMIALTSLVLSGFGIYLGRFLRWNSWDVFNPGLLGQIVDGLIHASGHTRTFSVTFIFGMILALGYVSVRVLLVHPPVTHDNWDEPGN
jgi:uncharacterized membrane protein